MFLETDSERERIAELYSVAGGKAAQSSAFEDAAAYFRAGIDLLPRDHWERDSLYSLCHQLYNCLAEMECCLGNTAKVDELCRTVLINSKSLEDQMRAYDTKIYSLSYRNEMNESIRVGLDVLRKLGVPVPRRIGLFLNIKELVTTRKMLKRFSCEDILRLRPLRKWQKVAALQIINLVFPAVLRSQPEYALFLTAKTIKITLRDGLSPLSAVLFSMFSMILCNPVGAVEEGIRCEEIGYRIFEKFQANDLRSRMFCIRFAYLKPYTDPMSKWLPGLVAGMNAGMSTGDIEMAFINSFVYSFDGILSGLSLRKHSEKMIRFKEQYGLLGQETVMFYMNIAIQLAQNLMGMVDNAEVLSGEVLDADESLNTFIATNNASGKSFLLYAQLFLALFIGNYQEAVTVVRRVQRLNMDNLTAFDLQYIHFLIGMSEMIMARTTTTNNKGHLRAGNKALKRLEKATRFHTTDCWISRTSLIKAERDAFQGLQEEAIRKYSFAAEKAKEFGYVHEEALAMERVGLLLLECNKSDKARECLLKARDLYDRWGCVVKSSIISEYIS
jgi:predicted ATPase